MGKSLKWAFLQFVKSHKLISSGQNVLVAVSGGIDSMALLSLIKEIQGYLKIEFAVVHINHRLRGEDAEADEKFIKQYCKINNITFFSHGVATKEFAGKNKYSIEEAGHLLREKIFRDYLNSGRYDLIATGHNLNDQAETILMRVIEGTGFQGLSGIRLKNQGIIRPLLFASRKEIEEYVKEKIVEYRQDKSNIDLRFKRNRIRHKLIPFVSNEFNGLNLNQFLNLGLIFQEWEDYSQKIVNALISELTVNDVQKIITLDKRIYQNYFSGIQIKILEYISSRLSRKKVVFSFNKFRSFNNWLNKHREGKYYKIIPEIVVSERAKTIIFQFVNPPSLPIHRLIKNEGQIKLIEIGCEIILKIVNSLRDEKKSACE
jgi:tRNA(Ile)-lysidine synthase